MVWQASGLPALLLAGTQDRPVTHAAIRNVKVACSKAVRDLSPAKGSPLLCCAWVKCVDLVSLQGGMQQGGQHIAHDNLARFNYGNHTANRTRQPRPLGGFKIAPIVVIRDVLSSQQNTSQMHIEKVNPHISCMIPFPGAILCGRGFGVRVAIQHREHRVRDVCHRHHPQRTCKSLNFEYTTVMIEERR